MQISCQSNVDYVDVVGDDCRRGRNCYKIPTLWGLWQIKIKKIKKQKTRKKTTEQPPSVQMKYQGKTTENKAEKLYRARKLFTNLIKKHPNIAPSLCFVCEGL
jgi:hypothetical protein